MLVIEAGIDIDMAVMNLVGTRGLIIAVVGSFLPIGVGVLIAWAINVGDWKAIIASGAVFGPTSLGIALNVLKGGKILFEFDCRCSLTNYFRTLLFCLSFHILFTSIVFGIHYFLVFSRWCSQYVS